MIVSSFNLLRSFYSGKSSGKGPARADPVASTGAISAALGIDEIGEGGSADSPKPSNASTCTKDSSSNKRRRTKQAVVGPSRRPLLPPLSSTKVKL